MPATEQNLMIDGLRRLAIATLAYAVAIAGVAGSLAPAFLQSHSVATVLPKPLPVVARSPHAAPGPEAAL